MKKITYFKKSFYVIAAMAMAFPVAMTLSSCEKDPDPTPTTKTLDKSKLYNKKWYPNPQVIIHEFKTGGVYGGDGTWKWVNNSDTMEIVYSQGEPARLWKFYWSADKEMACSLVGASEALYKDAPW